MNRFRPLVSCVFSFLLMLSAVAVSPAAARAQDHRKILGIMPVFDSSGEEYGEQFAQNLTAMEFSKLLGTAPFDVVLLNPGGLYNPPHSRIAGRLRTIRQRRHRADHEFPADHQAAKGATTP